jgi:hypothetical protein
MDSAALIRARKHLPNAEAAAALGDYALAVVEAVAAGSIEGHAAGVSILARRAE